MYIGFFKPSSSKKDSIPRRNAILILHNSGIYAGDFMIKIDQTLVQYFIFKAEAQIVWHFAISGIPVRCQAGMPELVIIFEFSESPEILLPFIYQLITVM